MIIIFVFVCAKRCPAHIMCFCFNILHLVYLMMPVSMDCPFQLDFPKKKSRAIVVTPASSSASGSVKFQVKFFVRVHFSKIYQRYPFETWNSCSLSKEEPITTRQIYTYTLKTIVQGYALNIHLCDPVDVRSIFEIFELRCNLDRNGLFTFNSRRPQLKNVQLIANNRLTDHGLSKQRMLENCRK